MTPPQPYRLVNARPSPYGRKVAIALIEKGIPFEVIDDEPWSDHTRTGDYGPLRQLPILITPDGYNVCDSSHILDWLEIVHPIPRLLPAMQSERIFALNMRTLGERLMEIAQGLIFEMYRDSPSSAYIARQTQKIYGGLVELERLSALLPARATHDIHHGHIAVATSLLVWEFVVSDGVSLPIDALIWRGTYPCLTSMIENVSRRQSFVDTLPMSMTVNIKSKIA